ncbi:MAG: 50S ribosomal protein L9, partial [Chloroflexi bacterium]|nr:50S ribosomal protein L9 [Chloroflexota bacterium]
LKRIETLKRAGDEQRAEELQGLQALGSRLDNASITFPARAGEGGRLYGSITTLTIAEELSKLVGQEIERRTVLLPEPIKALGTYQVKVRLNSQVTPTVTVVVEEERARAAAEPPTAAQEAPKPAQASAEAGGQGEAGQPVAQQGTPPPGEPVSAAEEAATREGDVRGEATST